MRFAIKKAGTGSERICSLSGFVKSPGTNIETPATALLTQGGSVVHLTSDVLSRVFPASQLLCVPLSNVYHLEVGVQAQGEGLAKFAGVPEHVACITLHNMLESAPAGHFQGQNVPLWTRNGKKMITADRYMDLMEIFKPDLFVAISDAHTNLSEGFKRISKSVERTCNLLDVCVDRYKGSNALRNSGLIGVIVGSTNKAKCDICIKHVLKYKESLTGVLLGGISDGSEESLNVPVDDLEAIFKRVGEGLPKDLLKVLEGCWNPAVTLAAVEHGWDLFDGTYAVKLTNAGYALNLNLDVKAESQELCILHLSDESYKEEFKPILQGCECLACRKHTRAYIRHLLNTREMLASVLLNIHNLHHFDQMFRSARQHIASNTFKDFRRHVTEQYYKYKDSVAEKQSNERSDIINTKEELQPKKKRVSEQIIL